MKKRRHRKRKAIRGKKAKRVVRKQVRRARGSIGKGLIKIGRKIAK